MFRVVTEVGAVRPRAARGGAAMGPVSSTHYVQGQKRPLPQTGGGSLITPAPGGRGHAQGPLKPGVAFPKEGSLWPLSATRVEDVDASDTNNSGGRGVCSW